MEPGTAALLPPTHTSGFVATKRHAMPRVLLSAVRLLTLTRPALKTLNDPLCARYRQQCCRIRAADILPARCRRLSLAPRPFSPPTLSGVAQLGGRCCLTVIGVSVMVSATAIVAIL